MRYYQNYDEERLAGEAFGEILTIFAFLIVIGIVSIVKLIILIIKYRHEIATFIIWLAKVIWHLPGKIYNLINDILESIIGYFQICYTYLQEWLVK